MEALNELIVPLGLVLIGFLGEVLRRWLKVKEAPVQLTLLANLANDIVLAADQFFDEGNNEERREWAENALTESAKRVGLKLKPSEAQAFIHAALSQVRRIAGEQSAFEDGYNTAALEAARFVGEVNDGGNPETV